MLAGCRLGERRVLELFDRFGAETVLAAWAQFEQQCRDTIRKTLESRIPDGTYETDDAVDGDGMSARSFHVRMSLTKEGGRITLDTRASERRSNMCVAWREINPEDTIWSSIRWHRPFSNGEIAPVRKRSHCASTRGPTVRSGARRCARSILERVSSTSLGPSAGGRARHTLCELSVPTAVRLHSASSESRFRARRSK